MKILVILSGGADSITMLHSLKKEGHELSAVSFFYGQKHSRELDMAKANCDILGVPHQLIDISFFGQISNSALTKSDHSVPEGHYADENMKQTVVPNRNMILMSIAGAIAMNQKLDAIAIGVHAGDHAIYPDCRSEFIAEMYRAFQLADWQKIELIAPFQFMDKSVIIGIGLKDGVDYSKTQTCYNGGEKACGKCGSCVERLEAFAKNNATDPLTYES